MDRGSVYSITLSLISANWWTDRWGTRRFSINSNISYLWNLQIFLNLYTSPQYTFTSIYIYLSVDIYFNSHSPQYTFASIYMCLNIYLPQYTSTSIHIYLNIYLPRYTFTLIDLLSFYLRQTDEKNVLIIMSPQQLFLESCDC